MHPTEKGNQLQPRTWAGKAGSTCPPDQDTVRLRRKAHAQAPKGKEGLDLLLTLTNKPVRRSVSLTQGEGISSPQPSGLSGALLEAFAGHRNRERRKNPEGTSIVHLLPRPWDLCSSIGSLGRRNVCVTAPRHQPPSFHKLRGHSGAALCPPPKLLSPSGISRT